MTDDELNEVDQLMTDSSATETPEAPETVEQPEVSSAETEVVTDEAAVEDASLSFDLGDGDSITAAEIKELRSGSMRFKDYTQKTQGVAEERRALESEREKLKKDAEFYAAEKQFLDDFHRIDKIITADPAKAEKFKALWAEAIKANEEQPGSVQIPDAFVARMDQLEQAEEDRAIDAEMIRVRKLVGDLDAPTEQSFYKFAEGYQERFDGVVPLHEVAKVFFHDRLVEKAMKARTEESASRQTNKAKTKPTTAGKKATPKKGTPSDDEMLADIEGMLGIK